MEIKKRLKQIEPSKEKGIPVITKLYLKDLCESLEMYTTPHLNDRLYLSNKGFNKMENLEEYFNIKALYFDSNAFSVIENIEKLTELRCLYLHNNSIDRIEGVDSLVHLNTLNLAHNKIKKVENLGTLYELNNLNLGFNLLSDKESLEGLLECPHLTQLNIEANQINLDEEELFSILSKLVNLKVLYLKGNPIVGKIKNYRKRVVAELQTLNYFDDRPVKEEERRLAYHWKLAGEAGEQAERQRIKDEKDRKYKSYIEEVKEAREEAKSRRRNHLMTYKEQLENEKKENAESKVSTAEKLQESENNYRRRLEEDGYKESEDKEDDETQIQSGHYKVDMLDRSIKANEMQIKLINEAIGNLDNDLEVKQPEPSIDKVNNETNLEIVDIEKLLGNRHEQTEQNLEWTRQIEEELQQILERCEFDFEKAAETFNDKYKHNVQLNEGQVRRKWTEIIIRKSDKINHMEELD